MESKGTITRKQRFEKRLKKLKEKKRFSQSIGNISPFPKKSNAETITPGKYQRQ